MNVLIPSPLRSYTGQRRVEAAGSSLTDLLRDLDRQFPGIRFRMINEQDEIRPHIRIFINGAQTFDLCMHLRPTDEVTIVQALSGG